MANDDSRLDELFQSYRASCPDVEADINFMPNLWRKIEARSSFWFMFQRWGRTLMTASAGLCVLLLVLNLVSSTQNYGVAPTYVDALMADHTAENTYYTEAIRSSSPNDKTPANDELPDAIQR